MAHGISNDDPTKKEHVDAPEILDKKLDQLADWIRNAKHFIVFTGAGISTSTGIPDFRSSMNTILPTGPGVWELRDHPGAKRAPNARTTSSTKAIPSVTHMALVELARRNLLHFVVSQNTDGLHLRSGLSSTLLAELHGNSNLETCKKCRTKYLRDYRTRTANKVHEHATTRKCTKCSSTLYDSIINFGENLPEYELETSFDHAERADVCLVLGSSLRVTPAANIPERVGERGGKLIIGNLQLTPLANLAKLNVHALCDDLMRGLMAKLDIPIPEWELHRRIRITIKDQTLSIMGLDLNQDIAYTLFSTIKISVREGTESKYDSKEIKGVEPIEHKIKVNNPNDKMNVYVELNWQGHYNEPTRILFMGSNVSQPPIELSAEDIEFISTKANIDHENVQVWYEKLKAACPNGKISKTDTVNFIRSINSGKEEQIQKMAIDIHKAFDTNNDGIVDQREFLIGFALTSTGSVREKLKYVFRTYDHDKDGVINKKEIDRMVKIVMRLRAKDDPENTARIIDDLKTSLEHLNGSKDFDDIKITSQDFIQLLMNNKELCELLSPFNIEQPREIIVQQSYSRSK
ncbi:unnamed protein product [Rotaria sordida]|uniref:Regulatory protein SIR2 homolog 7 n=1 Tax=Rotaria sordida TaxID=392033 RepID=A0A813PJ70_9BILA|nr:unnamed protein product [Rotaria sordida]CAF0802116.1 unnamed protein product [Rotaria sordida]